MSFNKSYVYNDLFPLWLQITIFSDEGKILVPFVLIAANIASVVEGIEH